MAAKNNESIAIKIAVYIIEACIRIQQDKSMPPMKNGPMNRKILCESKKKEKDLKRKGFKNCIFLLIAPSVRLVILACR